MKLTANIEGYEGAGYIAFIENIKGLVTQADTPQDAFKELIISLKVKMAMDYGFQIDGWQEKATDTHYQLDYQIELHEGKGQKEIDLKDLCLA